MTKIKVRRAPGPGSGDIVLMPAPASPPRRAAAAAPGAAAAGGGRAPTGPPPEEEAMAAGDGIPVGDQDPRAGVSLNANRMKFVGDLFGAGAVDTLFGEENMAARRRRRRCPGDRPAACRRPARCSRRPGRRPSLSTSGSAAATPTSPRRVARGSAPAASACSPGRAAAARGPGGRRLLPARARLYPPGKDGRERTSDSLSGEVCMRLRATWGENFDDRGRILCYHTQMRCRAAPDWGSARLGDQDHMAWGALSTRPAAAPQKRPGTGTVSTAWMRPFEHSTSDGQFDDFDGPSDLRPMIASSSHVLRAARR